MNSTKEILEAMGFVQSNPNNPEEFCHEGWQYYTKVGTSLGILFERLMITGIRYGMEQKENDIKKALGLK